MKKRKLFVGIGVILLVAAAAFIVLRVISDKKQSDTNKANAELDTSQVTPITDITVPAVSSVLKDESLSDIEKFIQLNEYGSNKIMVERYDEAVPYMEAAYDLNVNDQDAKDTAAYKLYLLGGKLKNSKLEKKYENALGKEKLETYKNARTEGD